MEKTNMEKTNVAALVSEAKAMAENLTPDEVASALDAGTLLIDIREEYECRAEGMIPGAVPAPRGMLEFWADPESPYHREEFDPARRTILYCASGGRSALATATLQRLGYTDVAHLDGGILAWKKDGLPVE